MSELIFENEIAVTAIVKNESRYIFEWLDYHYRIGVDKFYIYDNDSEDRSELMKILEPWIKNHIVDYKFFPGVCRQMPAYNDAIENHRFDCRYMAFIDIDDFIFVKTGQTLTEFLNDYFSNPEAAGLTMNWRMFGTSGKKFYEPADVTERCTFRIADPRKILYMPVPHCALYTVGMSCLDEKFNLVFNFKNEANTCEKIQCNHYFPKSVEEYEGKLSRGRADDGSIRSDREGLKPILNAVEDTGLRDLYRQLKSKPMPVLKDHSEAKIAANINTMLEPFLNSNAPDEIFRGQTERFLMCFCLIEKISLLTKKEKFDIKNLILEYLARSFEVTKSTPHDFLMVLNIWREIFLMHSKPAEKILDIIQQMLPQAVQFVEECTRAEESFILRHIQKDLDLILNYTKEDKNV